MPSLLFEFTTTWLPGTATPEMPAIKVAVCVPCLPMRILPDSPATPRLPISILKLPVVSLRPAVEPNAMLLHLLLKSALKPLAVLAPPLVL
jgi:hypothetical protein